MGEILLVLLLFMGACFLWSLPIYLSANFMLWVFHISFRLTWVQAFSLCLFSALLRELLFGGKEDKK